MLGQDKKILRGWERFWKNRKSASCTQLGVKVATETFLLTNNPKRWSIEHKLLADWLDATARGIPVHAVWSTGGTTKAISSGDRAFLLIQNVEHRGIFASGRFITGVYQGPHWDGTNRLANFAEVDWDTVIDPDNPLPIELLEKRLPQVHWTPQSSGTRINPVSVQELEDLWAAHIRQVRRTAAPKVAGTWGQRYRIDAKVRKAIEDLAQDRLTQVFVDAGWQVEDRRLGNPFDAVATKGGERVYLEAKGTTGSGDEVLVTSNEVEFAQSHDRCVMGVVYGIVVDENGVVDPNSGTLKLIDWLPDDSDLKAVSYKFDTSQQDSYAKANLAALLRVIGSQK